MPFDFKEAITFMEDYGFYDVVLPFLLVFTIIYATLQKIQIFGKESRRYNTLIALSIALMFTAATNLVEALNQYLPIIGVVLAAFLGIMLLLGMFGVEQGSAGTKVLGWVVTGGVILAIAFHYLSGLKGASGIYKILESNASTIIIVGIILGIILAVIKSGKEEKTESKPSQ